MFDFVVDDPDIIIDHSMIRFSVNAKEECNNNDEVLNQNKESLYRWNYSKKVVNGKINQS